MNGRDTSKLQAGRCGSQAGENSCPRIVIGGTGSGVGKTSVALALVRAFKRRGLVVQPFKVGPDFLDPTYLSRAAGRTCLNLDGWLTSKSYVHALFTETTGQAHIAIIEGVMGLFDGSDPRTNEGSTAEIAAWLQAPVLLVVNAHGVSRSVAALVKGFASFDSSLTIAGVVANRCGSERHIAWLSESLATHDLPKIVAAFPRDAIPSLPSRHLGLVTADEKVLSESVLDELADVVEQYGSVESIWKIARSAGCVSWSSTATKPRKGTERRIRLGIAQDQAFHFYYADNLAALERAGCSLVTFSPIRDSILPSDLDGLYIGGGYPEEYAKDLSENRSMLDSIRRFARTGKPLYAECGGLMYLSKGIELRSGERFGLVGVLPAWTRMLDKVRSLGYVEITLTQDSLFGKVGTVFRGHEFHYSELMEDPLIDPAWQTVYAVKRRRTDGITREGYQKGSIVASYVHMHFASNPQLVEWFVGRCRAENVPSGGLR